MARGCGGLHSDNSPPASPLQPQQSQLGLLAQVPNHWVTLKPLNFKLRTTKELLSTPGPENTDVGKHYNLLL